MLSPVMKGPRLGGTVKRYQITFRPPSGFEDEHTCYPRRGWLSRKMKENLDRGVVETFGAEWSTFDQSGLSEAEFRRLAACYFDIFPWDRVGRDSTGFDMGCGSGRWAKFVAPRVGRLHCVDASSDALAVAMRNLSGFPHVTFHQAPVGQPIFPAASMDFGYCLGVLHHVPDTVAGLRFCVDLLKPGAPFLLYLYYDLEDRPFWYRWIWRAADLVRGLVASLPTPMRFPVCLTVAGIVYWPLARAARLGTALGLVTEGWPLSFYKDASFYTMKTDAFDRFATALEKRFTKAAVLSMMETAGLVDVRFSEAMPRWVAVGIKAGA